MNHDKDLDRKIDITLLRFFDGQFSLSQTREAVKRLTGRSFLEIGEPIATKRKKHTDFAAIQQQHIDNSEQS